LARSSSSVKKVTGRPADYSESVQASEGRLYALKCGIRLNEARGVDPDFESLRNEAEILASLDCPFVVKTHGFMTQEKPERIGMLLDYCPGGDLFSLIHRQRSSLSKKIV